MTGPARRRVIGVMGAGACDAETAGLAEEVGRLVAESGAVLVCGGRGGVMEAAARGASRVGGLTVGVMPGRDDAESRPNPYVDVAIFTGMRDGRNWINACTSDAVIAIAGGWGTLSEVALAMKLGKPVVLLRSWRVDTDDASVERPATASTPAEAVAMVLEALR
jgi:uncharacterized protein (TIGR00725 family)